jgi:predicted ATPase/class 3 adenylate cyclase
MAGLIQEVVAAQPVLAFLFTDIEGSTRRWERFRDAMGEAVALHDRLIAAAIAEAGGTLIKRTGDGACAAFATAADALRAAASIQHRMAAADFSAVDGLRVRIGVHIGPAEARDGDFFGPTLNRCARIMGIGHGGQVLMSTAAAEAADDALHATGFGLRSLGAHRLKDLTEAEELYQLTGPALDDLFPALRSLDARPNNLPIHASSFIGRERDLAALQDMLARHRLVTLLGPGGIGKTRLSLQIGADRLDRFADGVWFLELAPLGEDAQIGEALARLFGIRAEGGRPVIETVAATLRQRTLLLIIDNCEHLIEGAAQVVATLLRACRGVVVLASSRMKLGVAGEQCYPVPPLDAPPPVRPGRTPVTAAAARDYTAMRLFVARAQNAHPGFVLDDANVPVVATICRRLDGIALAIELAAARIRLLDPAALLARLDDRFRLLTGGTRSGLPHQQTLRALIGWSHDLLNHEEQIAFRRLAVFAGSITLASAEAVIAGGPIEAFATLDLVTGLLDKSLIARVPQLAHDTRLRLLESTRAFALEQLEASGEADAVQRVLAAHLVVVFAEAEARWALCDTQSWRAEYQPDIDNLRSAIAWAFGPHGDPALGVALVARTTEAARDGLVGREHAGWVDQAIAAMGPDTGPESVARLRFIASGGYTIGDARDIEGCRAAHALFVGLGDTVRGCRAAMSLAWALARPGDVAPAQPYIDYVMSCLPSLPIDKHRGIILHRLATLACYAGDQAQPRLLWQEAISIAERFKDAITVRLAALNLADFEASLGQYAEAARATAEVVQTCRDSEDQALLSSALTNLTTYSLMIGDTAAAQSAGREAIGLLLEQSDEVFLAICCESMAYLAALSGASATALAIAACTDEFFASRGLVRDVAEQTVWAAMGAILGDLRTDAAPLNLREAAALACAV